MEKLSWICDTRIFLLDFDIVFKHRDKLEGVTKRFSNMIKELRY